MRTPHALRPAAAIIGAVAAFALLIERAGLIPAVLATSLIASQGDSTATLRGSLALAVLLALAIVLLFVGLLDQPFTLVSGL